MIVRPWLILLIMISLTIGVAGPATIASAHEVRPSYLELKETGPGQFATKWKMPLRSGMRLKLRPFFPAYCEAGPIQIASLTEAAVVESWSLDCGAVGLSGGTIGMNGLDRTLTDVLVRIEFLDGEGLTHTLRPNAPEVEIGSSGGSALGAYLGLGIRHILLGLDHILFVIGLMFVVRGIGLLVKTITAFTIAHSLTLGLSAFGVLSLRQAPVEAVVALSILFLAVELARSKGKAANTLTFRYPWAIAFLFGLLHGVGFASALQDIGLPENAALLALLLFNLGVEIGQLGIVAIVLLQIMLSRNLIARLPEPIRLAPIYVIGVVSAYWFIERLTKIA